MSDGSSHSSSSGLTLSLVEDHRSCVAGHLGGVSLPSTHMSPSPSRHGDGVVSILSKDRAECENFRCIFDILGSEDAMFVEVAELMGFEADGDCLDDCFEVRMRGVESGIYVLNVLEGKLFFD